jgi:CRISPR-associated protein Csx10
MALKRARVRITPQSPLNLGRVGGLSNFLETEDYVPGSALRGAVAGRLLVTCQDERYLEDHAKCPERDGCPFWQVFGAAQPPLFRDALVSRQRLPSQPYPLTARTCKIKKGFKSDDPENHGVFDALVRQVVFEERVRRRARIAALYRDDCPVCGNSTVPPSGCYGTAWEEGQQRYHDAGRPLLERVSHTAINRTRGVAEDGLLFTIEQIIPDTEYVFEGQVAFDDAYQETLFGALSGEQRIGRGASRGLGRTKVELVGTPVSVQPLSDRFQQLNELLATEWAFYAAMDPHAPLRPAGVYFTLDLVSEALLPDVIPSVLPDPAQLRLPAGVELVRAWARTALVSGWHGAARMPRRTQVAVQRGSVYLFRAPPATMDEAMLLETLENLELTGIGRERERGYGQVVACAPIHLEVEPR